MRTALIVAIVILLIGIFIGSIVTIVALDALDSVQPILTEQARAQALKAQAEASREQAQAARVWLDVQAQAGAQQAEIVARQIGAVGLALALALAMVGGAGAGITWLSTRAKVVYPTATGQWPLIVEAQPNGTTRIIDTSRALAPVTIVERDGSVEMVFAGHEETARALATQAQAGTLLAGMTGRMADPTQTVSAARERGVPVPQFRDDGGPAFVFVNDPQRSSRIARDKSDIHEMIVGAAVRGLAREAWLGVRLKSGNSMTRKRYDGIIETLKRANVVEQDGNSHRLSVTEREALTAFQIGDGDAE